MYLKISLKRHTLTAEFISCQDTTKLLWITGTFLNQSTNFPTSKNCFQNNFETVTKEKKELLFYPSMCNYNKSDNNIIYASDMLLYACSLDCTIRSMSPEQALIDRSLAILYMLLIEYVDMLSQRYGTVFEPIFI